MNNSVIVVGIVILLGILIAGGFFEKSGKIESDMNISAEEFKQKLDQEPGIVIDVRTVDEYKEGHLARTDYNYDFMSGEFEDKLASLDRDKTYYLYCRTGNRSGKAAEMMKKYGFENIYNIGGYSDLVGAGLASEK